MQHKILRILNIINIFFKALLFNLRKPGTMAHMKIARKSPRHTHDEYAKKNLIFYVVRTFLCRSGLLAAIVSDPVVTRHRCLLVSSNLHPFHLYDVLFRAPFCLRDPPFILHPHFLVVRLTYYHSDNFRISHNNGIRYRETPIKLKHDTQVNSLHLFHRYIHFPSVI